MAVKVGRCTTGCFGRMRKDPTTEWTKLDSSLHSSTFLAFRTGTGTFCPLCFDCDHIQTECALAPYSPTLQLTGVAGQYMQPYPSQSDPGAGMGLPPICISWNRGRCAKAPPAICNYRHTCATCGRKEHPACECWLTPADSFYRRGPLRANKAPRLPEPRKGIDRASRGIPY